MFFKIQKTIIGLAIIAILSSINIAASAGPGDLLVSPVRVVMEGRDRVAEVTLVNKGQTKSIYRVSFENRRMKRDGTFERIETPGEGDLFAENMVRYAPRRVELEPNAPQTLRLMLRKPSDLADGEYRSHLHFAAVPEDASSNSIEAEESDGTTLSIRLTPIYGVTIPIIVRHGDVSASADIKAVDYKPTKNGEGKIALTIARTGNMSLYGDISIFLEGEETPAVQKRGVAIYVPNTDREIEIPVSAEVAKRILARNVEIKFQDRTQSGSDITASAFALLN